MVYQLVVDLGTCHTVAVVRRDGQAPRPLLFDGSPLLPSGVYRDPHGALTVGRDAERLSQLDPSRFEPYPKRCVDDGTVLLGDGPTPVVELLAALLRRVVAETSSEGLPRAVTLTCPADWGPQRRDVLRAAARAAGLAEVRLLDEPIAAATYCAEVLGQPIPPGGCLLVFDFGGGTLDVTVVRRDPDGLRVLSVGGLDDLGGVDVDAALVGHLGQLVALRQPQAWQRLVHPGTPAEQRDRRAFWAEVKAAKEMLSRAPAAPVQVPGTDDAIHLTREELERVAGPLVDRAVDETRRVLDRAQLPPGALAGILLVGGSSRIPLVASRLHARFQLAPTVPEQPELPVAFGGLLTVPPQPSAPRSPAAGPTGPVSAAPYASSPVTGPTPLPPPAWTPAPPRTWALPPQQQAPFAPQPPVPAPGYYKRVVRYAYLRTFLILLVVVALVVVLAIFGGRLITSGSNLFNGLTHGGGPGSGGDPGQPGTGGPLTLVGSEIDLGGDGAHAVAAGADLVFYAVTGNGKTAVHAVDPASGKDRWSVSSAVEPAEASLTVAGDLLLLDAKKSATDGGKDMRVVYQVSDGHELRKLDWSARKDAAYLGSDVIVSSDRPYQTQRVNLRTGQVAWTHPAPKDVFIADHRVNPELTWNPDGRNGPVPVKGVAESFGANPNRVVELNTEAGTADVLDGNGKQLASGQVPVDDKLWTAFDGLLVGALTSEASAGRPQLAGYRLDNLKPAWPAIGLTPGDEIKYVHPCGAQLVCATYQKKSDDTGAILVVDTRTGQKVTWTRQPAYGEFSEEPYWLVQGGLMVYGEGTFPPQLGCRRTGIEVLNSTTGELLHALAAAQLGCPDSLIGAAGKYVAMSSVHVDVNTSRTSWQVSLVDVSTGKQSDRLDVGPASGQVDGIAVLGTTLGVIGTDHKLRVASAAKLA